MPRAAPVRVLAPAGRGAGGGSTSPRAAARAPPRRCAAPGRGRRSASSIESTPVELQDEAALVRPAGRRPATSRAAPPGAGHEDPAQRRGSGRAGREKGSTSTSPLRPCGFTTRPMVTRSRKARRRQSRISRRRSSRLAARPPRRARCAARRAVRPPRPMTRPRSAGATSSSSTRRSAVRPLAHGRRVRARPRARGEGVEELLHGLAPASSAAARGLRALLEQAPHGVGGLRALADPVLAPAPASIFTTAGSFRGIVVPEHLHEASVAPRPRVGHHHAVVRPLRRPRPSQPDRDSICLSCPCSL